jgi:hypothetical protein
MDPVMLIVSALAAGAAAAAKDTAGQAVKDAYSGLKALLARKLGGRPTAATILDEHEKAPDVWEKPLEHELMESGVVDDEDLVRAAQAVMASADPQGAQIGKYNVVIKGGKGIAIGDHQTVTMSFNNKD